MRDLELTDEAGDVFGGFIDFVSAQAEEGSDYYAWLAIYKLQFRDWLNWF